MIVLPESLKGPSNGSKLLKMLSVGGNITMDDKKSEHDHKQSPVKKDETYTFSKVNIWQGVAAILGILLIVSLFTGGFGIGDKDSGKGSTGGTVQPTPTPGQPAPTVVDVDVDDDPVLGDEDAPVTIVEFSDYQCPFCGRHFQQVHPELVKNYVDTGKVKIVFRDFPLSFHPNAEPAAEAAECVKDLSDDKTYYEFHDKLFGSQAEWSGTTGSATTDLFVKYGKEVGVDEADLKACIASGKFQQEVQADFNYGSSVGVSGTPTFFVNGVKIVGAQPYTAFQSAIESALEG